ncbi:MAG: hypothetical protein ACK6AD_01750 [Cyanobacteriota bacterium]
MHWAIRIAVGRACCAPSPSPQRLVTALDGQPESLRATLNQALLALETGSSFDPGEAGPGCPLAEEGGLHIGWAPLAKMTLQALSGCGTPTLINKQSSQVDD